MEKSLGGGEKRPLLNWVKPPEGLFNFGPFRGGLIERGGSFTKSSEKDIVGSFSVLLSHIQWNRHALLRLKYINSTQFVSQNMQGFVAK